jgi:hypothetical protein
LLPPPTPPALLLLREFRDGALAPAAPPRPGCGGDARGPLLGRGTASGIPEGAVGGRREGGAARSTAVWAALVSPV